MFPEVPGFTIVFAIVGFVDFAYATGFVKLQSEFASTLPGCNSLLLPDDVESSASVL